MRLFTMLLAFLFWAAFLPITSATAAPKGDVEKVVKLIENPKVKGAVTVEQNKNGTTEISFREKGVTYSIFYSGKGDGGHFMTIWVKRAGETSRSVSDNQVDGLVDTGLLEWGVKDRKVYYSSNSLLGDPQGAEHQEFWQHEYDQAIAAALRCLH